MDFFQYTLKLDEINKLKTKASITAMKNQLKVNIGDFYTFKAFTYLLYTHSDKLDVGRPLSDVLAKTILRLHNEGKYTIKDITEYCNTPVVITENHYFNFVSSKYVPYQIIGQLLTTIKIKES